MTQIIDNNLSYTTNAIRIYSAVQKEEVIVNDAIELTTKTIGGKTEKPGSEADICSLIERINTLKKLIEIFVSIPELFKEFVEYCVNNIEYFLSQIILKYIEIIVLHIKKIISIIKRTVAEWTKMILQWASAGKGGAVVTALISPVILLYKGISILATGILMGIQVALSVLPSMIVVPAEGMSFFLTPKSMKLTEMNVVNSSRSVIYWLPPAVMDKINDIVKSIDKINIPLKVSGIAAGALLTASTIATASELKVHCPDSSKLNPETILKLINEILKTLAIPQPLPKYENLSLLNLGFLAWLLTGFCPAGQASFGLPG